MRTCTTTKSPLTCFRLTSSAPYGLKRNRSLALVAGLALAFAPGCSDDDDDTRGEGTGGIPGAPSAPVIQNKATPDSIGTDLQTLSGFVGETTSALQKALEPPAASAAPTQNESATALTTSSASLGTQATLEVPDQLGALIADETDTSCVKSLDVLSDALSLDAFNARIADAKQEAVAGLGKDLFIITKNPTTPTQAINFSYKLNEDVAKETDSNFSGNITGGSDGTTGYVDVSQEFKLDFAKFFRKIFESIFNRLPQGNDTQTAATGSETRTSGLPEISYTGKVKSLLLIDSSAGTARHTEASNLSLSGKSDDGTAFTIAMQGTSELTLTKEPPQVVAKRSAQGTINSKPLAAVSESSATRTAEDTVDLGFKWSLTINGTPRDYTFAVQIKRSEGGCAVTTTQKADLTALQADLAQTTAAPQISP